MSGNNSNKISNRQLQSAMDRVYRTYGKNVGEMHSAIVLFVGRLMQDGNLTKLNAFLSDLYTAGAEYFDPAAAEDVATIIAAFCPYKITRDEAKIPVMAGKGRKDDRTFHPDAERIGEVLREARTYRALARKLRQSDSDKAPSALSSRLTAMAKRVNALRFPQKGKPRLLKGYPEEVDGYLKAAQEAFEGAAACAKKHEDAKGKRPSKPRQTTAGKPRQTTAGKATAGKPTPATAGKPTPATAGKATTPEPTPATAGKPLANGATA